MGQTKLGSAVVSTVGEMPAPGTAAPNFALVGNNMRPVKLSDFAQKNVILNIFPSVDTSVCATSVKQFNKRAASLPDTVVLCVSKDLPFAMRRFCGAEGIDKVLTLSDFRNKGFSKDYGVQLVDGGFEGLLARAIVVVGKDGKVKHTELVPSIDNEPNYDAAIAALA